MFEVILYAAIATVICAMLFSVLGKNMGAGPEDAIDPTKFMVGAADEKPAVIDPLEETGEFTGIAAIRNYDPGFSLTKFLDQAQGAYAIILESFADGDRALLGELLTDKVYKVYDSAITDREVKNLTQITDLARLIHAEVKDVEASGAKARISVKFEAELASALKDSEGNVVQGDADLLSRSAEVWSFERDMKSNSPNWLLADVAPSDSILDADPSPDTLH